MDRVASYKIVPERKLIIEYFSGSITWNDVKSIKKLEVADVNYDSTYDMIGDIRDCLIEYQSNDDVIEFLEFVKALQKSNSQKKVGILTANPNNVVSAELLILNKSELPQILKPFSTIEGVLKWLNVDDDAIPELIEHLEEHRRNPINIL